MFKRRLFPVIIFVLVLTGITLFHLFGKTIACFRYPKFGNILRLSGNVINVIILVYVTFAR